MTAPPGQPGEDVTHLMQPQSTGTPGEDVTHLFDDTSTSTVPVRTGPARPPIEQPTIGGALANFGRGAWGAVSGPVQQFMDAISGTTVANAVMNPRAAGESVKATGRGLRDTARTFRDAPVDTTLKTIYDDPVAFGATVAGAGELGGNLLARTGLVSPVLTATRGIGTPSTVAAARARGVLPQPPTGGAPEAYARAQTAMGTRGAAAKAVAGSQYDAALSGPLGDVRVPTGHMLEPPPVTVPVDESDMAHAAWHGTGRPNEAGYIIQDTGNPGYRAATDLQRGQATPVFDKMQRAGQFRGDRTVQNRFYVPPPAEGAPVPETVSFREAHEIKGQQTPFRNQGVAPVTAKDRMALQSRREIEGQMKTAAKDEPFAQLGLRQYKEATKAYKNYVDTFERGPAKKARDVAPADFTDFMLKPSKWNPTAKSTSAVRYESGELPRKMQPAEIVGQFRRAAGPEAWNDARQHLQNEFLNRAIEDGRVNGKVLKANLEELDAHGVTKKLLPNAEDLRAYAENRISQAQFRRRLKATVKFGAYAAGLGVGANEAYRAYREWLK